MPDGSAVEVVVREAEGSDAEAVAGLVVELGYQMSAEQAAERIGAFAAKPGHIMLVGEVEGVVSGVIAGHLAEIAVGVGRYGVISSMSVTEKRRRLGIGGRLVEQFEEWVKEEGGRLIHVTSRSHRTEDAHRFYPALGYELAGVRFDKHLDSR